MKGVPTQLKQIVGFHFKHEILSRQKIIVTMEISRVSQGKMRCRNGFLHSSDSFTEQFRHATLAKSQISLKVSPELAREENNRSSQKINDENPPKKRER